MSFRVGVTTHRPNAGRIFALGHPGEQLQDFLGVRRFVGRGIFFSEFKLWHQLMCAAMRSARAAMV